VGIIAQLPELLEQLDAVSAHAQRLADRLDGEAFTRRPAAGRWSAAEHIAHLNLTAAAYFPVLDDAISRARRENLRGQPPFKLDFWGRLLKAYLEPPFRMRTKTTQPFIPPENLPGRETFNAFLFTQAELRKRYTGSKGLALDQLKVSSPFAKKIHYSVFSALHLIVAHERRHLWIVEQSLTNPQA